MPIRIILFLGCFILTTSKVMGEPYQLRLIKTIPVRDGYFTTDPIGNIYLVKDNNFIVKYSPTGDSLGVFNDIASGKVTMIDATNPLRILVFYSGFSQIKILDNMMSKKNQLDLKRIGLFNIPAIANSMDGNIWIFDPVGELVKIDERLEIKHAYLLRNMIDFPVSACHLIEKDRVLYMTDSTEGILQFDRFGFYKTIYRFNAKEVEVINNYLVYYTNGSLNSYNIQTFRSSEIRLPEPNTVINARLEKNQVYILRNDRLEIYLLQQK